MVTKQFLITPKTKIFKSKIMGYNILYEEELEEEPASFSEIQVGTQVTVTYREQEEPDLSTKIVILDMSAISQIDKNEGFAVYYLFKEEDTNLLREITKFADEHGVKFMQVQVSADQDFDASKIVGVPVTVKTIPAIVVTAKTKGPTVLAIRKDVSNDVYIENLKEFYAQPAIDTILT